MMEVDDSLFFNYIGVADFWAPEIDSLTVTNNGDVVTSTAAYVNAPLSNYFTVSSRSKATVTVSGLPTGVTYNKTTAGLTLRLAFMVTDVAALDPTAPGANPSVAKSRTFGDQPVIDETTKRLTGILTGLTIPPTGRCSAKYKCRAGTICSRRSVPRPADTSLRQRMPSRPFPSHSPRRR